MSGFALYRARCPQPPDAAVSLPVPPGERDLDPAGYLPGPGLVQAVNVALQLGLPLLLTGEPGTGKTQLAYSVAWQLGFDRPLKFETKSTSVARDLFYTYDIVGRFAAAQLGQGPADPAAFIQLNALGTAILRACGRTAVPEALRHSLDAELVLVESARRSVVLIDEVDKAPRDFPNDILNEIEGMYFRIPELGNQEVRADPALRPIVILTSNDEKNLPAPFLRRCAFYHIPFPDDELREIVARRVGRDLLDDALLGEALDFFFRLREDADLTKSPSTGELLAWLRLLGAGGRDGSLRGAAPDARLEATLGVLAKTRQDLEEAVRLLREWASPPPS